MEDKVLRCQDCQEEFIFTVGEQEFFEEKGFDSEPIRCPDCRRAKKQRNNQQY
ncbi:zinc-ribbon domain-containing protein [Clostridium estertheticum]|uniref:zinc-ribbon domain-containing protein n=1 Tax=Clostridium estertheticum TaxID=238834 RepID=UPI00124D85D8|nr:zinc-ribbon domain-containing protein [Clostridium estertheticum]MBZ9616780.1 zinc-ribbon domain-containing protein [Clostridium estertheticum subsp. laramiense]WAG72487.1 zinc-ribbon domain-containing protein [Clostridium estertheticum]